MKVKTLLSRVSGMLILACVLMLTTGCNKMLANFSLNQANKRLTEAVSHDAEQFDKEGLAATRKAIEETQGFVASQDFRSARTRGKDAATLSKTLLETVKTRRSTFLKDKANEWLGYAKINEAQSEDPTRYQEVIEMNRVGLAAHEKKKWDKSIQNFDKVVTTTTEILANLKRRAELGLADVAKKKEELIAVEAPEHYPEGITENEDFHTRIQDLITNKYDYRTAISTADLAIQAAEKSKTKAKEVKSEKLIKRIEAALTRATQLGAQIYAIETFNSVSRDFEEVLRQHYAAKYDTVLNQTTGPDLLTRAEELIIETQRESARAKVNNVDKAIADLTEGKAKFYLPGRVEEMEKLLVDAKALFDQQKYPETEVVAKQALDMETQIVDDFDALTQQHLADATQQVNVTKGIFDRMQQIFERKSPIQLTGDEKVFEDRKLAMREELKGRLNNAEVDLGVIDTRRQNKEFSTAIETAQKTVKEAQDIVTGTYRVVSFDAIQELTNMLTIYERQGGREYATKDLNEAQDLLMASREAHNQADYRLALDRAAATHAKLEDTIQALERYAVSKIETAKKELDTAKQQRAEEFQEAKLGAIGTMIDEASEQLTGEALKRSIEVADEAIRTAKNATEESLRMWAEEDMRRTDLLLARAKQAGAEAYAPGELHEAVELRRNADALYTAGDYAQAQTTSTQAEETAERALYAPVIKAEDQIAAAKRYDGWRHEWQRLSEAMVNASYAREFMDQGNFELARRHAESSYQMASAVVVDSKKATFYDRLNTLNSKVDVASRKGVGYYQVNDLSKILGEMNAIATEFQPENYDQAAERIQVLEAQLAGLIEMTPNVLQDLVNNMNDRLANLEGRGAASLTPDMVAEAGNKIKYAQLDFRNQKYRPSFENAKAGLSLMQQIELRLNERDYDMRLSEAFTRLSAEMENFGPILNAGAPVIMELAKGPTGQAQSIAMNNATDPTNFRQNIVDLATQVRTLEPPSTRREVHQAAVEMFEQAKTAAAGFEKMLILDQYKLKDARKIIETSFLQMRAVRSRQQEIQFKLKNPQTHTKQAGVRRELEMRTQ